ncbi:hypothetical protein STRIP9103_05549 [Streptomyces ipomoeae 91-03]|uniref:Uncharacterized protein n=1 Tax=Streptomyces ipomoeae 91-03 TaxID=698759 RepID=L1KP08_9ACTN|nr:hypothetical protein STRIP9103_05549 [Streptomyces ipomoeae 91-03]
MTEQGDKLAALRQLPMARGLPTGKSPNARLRAGNWPNVDQQGDHEAGSC